MMTMNSNKKTAITKKEFRQMFTRSCTLDSAWNYERQQHINYCYMMIPVLKRLYGDDKEAMAKALNRHLEFMSCTPHLVSFLGGITAAMEEENVNNPEFDETSISSVKTSLMGPIAGVGDSFFWGTLLTIAVGIGTSLGANGSIMGPIIFFLTINVPGFLSRYYGLKVGYGYGTKFFSTLNEGGLIETITKAASVLGLLVIGSMIPAQVAIETPIELTIGSMVTPLQGYFNDIMPALLPLAAFGIMYTMLGKKVKSTTILLGLVIFGLVTSYFGIL